MGVLVGVLGMWRGLCVSSWVCCVDAERHEFPDAFVDTLMSVLSSYKTSRTGLNRSQTPHSVAVATEVLRQSERVKDACQELLQAATREHESATRVLASAVQHRAVVLNHLRHAVTACHSALSTGTRRVADAVETRDVEQVLLAAKQNQEAQTRGCCQAQLQHALDACGAVGVDVDHLGSLDSEEDTTVVRDGAEMQDTLQSYVTMEARLPGLIQVW